MYSSIKTYGKVSLPSVEGWNGQSSIVKDPLKSVTTRRREKVGVTNTILEMMENSFDRNDAFAPVKYGTNPHMESNSMSAPNGSKSSSFYPKKNILPNRQDESIRVELSAPRDMLALSRQSRPRTSVAPVLKSVDHTIRLVNIGDQQKEVHSTILKPAVRPVATFKLAPSMDLFEGFQPLKIIENPLTFSGKTNISAPFKQTQEGGFEFHTENFTKDELLNFNATTNKGRKIDVGLNAIDDVAIYTQDGITTTFSTNKSSKNNIERDDKDITLLRNLPEFSTKVSKVSHDHIHQERIDKELQLNRPNIQQKTNLKAKGEDQVSTREYSLKPRIEHTEVAQTFRKVQDYVEAPSVFLAKPSSWKDNMKKFQGERFSL